MIPGIIAGGMRRGGVPKVLWTPANLTVEPKVWLDDSSSLIEASGVVQQWDDKTSQSLNFSQSTAANRPTLIENELNGKRIIRFDGSNDFLSNTTAASQNILRNVPLGWALTVHKKRTQAGGSGNCALLGMPTGGSSGARAVLSTQGGRIGYYARRTDAEATSSAFFGEVNLDWQICVNVLAYSDGVGRMRQNGSEFASSSLASSGVTSNTAATFGTTIGTYTRSNTPGEMTDSDVAAVLIGATSLPDIERLEGWAAWRYALQGNLPSGHPYKNAPPYVE